MGSEEVFPPPLPNREGGTGNFTDDYVDYEEADGFGFDGADEAIREQIRQQEASLELLRRPDETWHEWAERTERARGVRGAGSTAIEGANKGE